ncbi:hypothetical protein GALL_64340 [mine drainage metagenome]|uniref:Uncharacterized protein n=1 Tax=mine drainage metagenome TaxID=410659 RepID=A0A1J5SUM5_9ZZZZ
MEVHHHPQIEKKSFKEYLLEGLMIFLAVTMGFFAENIREYSSDKTKEKEYIENIKKDLARDTSNLNIWIDALYKRVESFDSLITILQQPGPTDKGQDLYYFARVATRSGRFEINLNSFNEMKNSGNTRLIKKRELLNGMLDYEKNIYKYEQLGLLEAKENEMVYPLIGLLFDASVFEKMFIHSNELRSQISEKDFATGSRFYIRRPEGNPQLRNRNPDLINQMIYFLHQRKSTFFGETTILLNQKKMAIDLIELFTKEYHLENK